MTDERDGLRSGSSGGEPGKTRVLVEPAAGEHRADRVERDRARGGARRLAEILRVRGVNEPREPIEIVRRHTTAPAIGGTGAPRRT